MYSSVTDMIARFGQAEMIRLTTPPDQEMETVHADMVTRALVEASALIDSYLRARYTVPVVDVLPEITRAAAMLARYDLSLGEAREPSEQTRLARKEVIEWLERLHDGKAVLDINTAPPGDDSFAQMADRPAVYS